MKQGWISVHRQLQKHWLWADKPFSKGQAWIDMLMMANHADKKFLLGNELVEVKAGNFITSELKLAEKWGWSKTKVRAFLKLLQKDSMIVKKSDRKKTTIIIENYSDYQDIETTEEPQKNHEETTEEPQKNTNNNVNNDNNDNKYNNIAKNDYQHIVDLYHLHCPSFPKIRKLSEDRKKAIRARMNFYKEEDFETLFKKAEASDFLRGSNKDNWSADFDWLIRDRNIPKVLEGKYDNKGDYENAKAGGNPSTEKGLGTYV